MQQIVDMVKKVIANLSKICPRTSINMNNVTFPAHKLFSMLPTGFYKLVLHVRFRETSPIMFSATGVFQFESLKDRLGN